ncbi:GIY-YIG nuclease family protein [Candidatus Avelusimicrobium fimicolum]|jgi:putative endonuclease|uniref:GIY-YIG nuclease family protein n=1 Tax=Candidatus Avelusimicrobium fimicolum TaxID=3416216 RepID=UPI0015B28FCA
MSTYAVYILASKRNGTLYTGVTNNLLRRIWEHKNNIVEGFTKKYNVHLLVHYELFTDIRLALAREKEIKQWTRAWKTQLIEKDNPLWKDLYFSL